MESVIGTVPKNVRCLVAKQNSEEEKWLPLWVHSIDTCGVADRLYNDWLPESTRRALTGEMTDEAFRYVIRAAAALHDLGKATALFQTRITEHCPPLQQRLTAEGLGLLTASDQGSLHGELAHGAAGEVLLLMSRCPLSFAEVIGAHHGCPWPEGVSLADELQEESLWPDIRAKSLWGSKAQRENWRTVQKECRHWMLDLADYASLEELPDVPQPMAMLLSSMVIIADWISSNESYFPLIPLETDDPGDMAARLERGWQEIALPSAWKPCSSKDLDTLCLEQFKFPANAVQRAMLTAVQDSAQPGLMILEAPMGLGKTEAALLTANLLSQRGAGGIFFGLPTQATANAIFSRLVQWRKTQPDTNQHSIRLAHGMAELNEDYQSLMAGSQVSNVEEDGEQESRLVVHEWFRGRKQALLADFVVGTVDQALMAALKQKHVMLRHLGLCGKVVVIDECHAYDAYMNQYLEAALRWLGSYRTPVILLSATLPKARRAGFLAAYLNQSSRARSLLVNEPWYHSTAYPALTWTDGSAVRQLPLPYDRQSREVALVRLTHADLIEEQVQAVVETLRDALRDGGCAAVILNTVQRAQYFYQVLKRTLKSAYPDLTILLLHSRFIMPDRLVHENKLLELMGKKSDKEHRNRVVVIGTQVIEQSLDFDADVMISDLCPMDFLLQRIGRLHRHSLHDEIRPENLRQPRCYVLCAEGALDRGAKAVYGEYLLMRTRALLPEAVRLPGDIARLVNTVYDENFPLPQTPEGYDRAKQKDELKRSQLMNQAKQFCLHNPDGEFCRLLSDGSIPPDDEHARAQVRAGDLSVDALLLARLPSGELSLLPHQRKGEAWGTEECPSQKDARKLLPQRINLTSGLLQALLQEMTWDDLMAALALPDAWAASPLLKHARLLVLDEQSRVTLGGFTLTYSEEIGLQWEKEGDEA